MTSPRITMALVDPGGSGRPVSTDQVPILAGVAEAGTNYLVQEFATPAAIIAEHTRGHLVDVGLHHLALGMPSVKLARMPATTTGAASATVGTGNFDGTVNNDPTQYLAVEIEALNGSSDVANADLHVRYSLDNFDIPLINQTWSASVLVPASGILSLADTGLTITIDGAVVIVDGDTITFTTDAGEYSATEIALLLPQLKVAGAGEFKYVCYCGDWATSADAATAGAGVIATLLSMFNLKRPIAALMSSGNEGDTESVTAWSATDADPPFLSAGFGEGYVTNPRASIGRGRFALREHEVASARIARSLISTDPGRTASGSLKQVVGMSYDAALQGDTVHDARISSLKSWSPAARGTYVQRQLLMSPTGSDFVAWPHAAIMVEALRAAHRSGFLVILDTLRKNADNTMDSRDAKSIEEMIFAELERTLLEPLNVRGTKGHVSAVGAIVNRATELPVVDIEIILRSVDWPTDIAMTLRYASNIG